jgi:hypothetical protein
MTADIGEVERNLKATVGEAANLSKFAVETGNSLGELEKHISQIFSLQDQLTADSSVQTAETEKAFQIFLGSIAETEMSVESLKQSEKAIAAMSGTLGNLLLAVNDFKLPPPPVDTKYRMQTNYPNPLENDPPHFTFEEN